MKNVKSTIISGKAASGKSWIGQAIINQYNVEDVGRLFAHSLLDKINDSDYLFLSLLGFEYKLLLIDGCRGEEIPELEIRLKEYTRCAVIYMTKDKISTTSSKYHIINCNNDY